jgi:hypothetical protein
MIVDNFYFVRVAVPPKEAYSPLIIYPNAHSTVSGSDRTTHLVYLRLNARVLNKTHLSCVRQVHELNELIPTCVNLSHRHHRITLEGVGRPCAC